MMEKVSVIKIGGNVVDNPEALAAFTKKFCNVSGNKILVHGGGVMASKMLKSMGIEPKMLNGRRITDAETLKVVTMVYAGWINKNIVADLQKNGCNAVGLSGADANSIPATLRPKEPVDYGFVGDVDTSKINVVSIQKLVASGFCPVFCSITHDGKGQLLNTNADTVASSIAIALASKFSVKLIFCFEKDGVLKDVNDDSSLIEDIDEELFENLKKEGVIDGGMLPKLENAFNAIDKGVSEVIITNALNIDNERHTSIHK